MPVGSYDNFDLLIDRGPNGYRARVIRSLAGETAVEFTLPFTDDELADFLWRSFGRGRHLGARPDGEGAAPVLDARDFGQRLYAAVFAGGVGVCLRRSLDKAQAQDQGLRIRLRLDPGVPELADLPWEYLFATDLDRFLALSDATPLVRYLEVAEGVQPLQVTPPLTLLAIIANPSDVPPLAVEEEWRRLQTALADLQALRVIRLERLNPATWPALQARLRQGDIHILHFVGHGLFDSATGTGGLIFEDAAGHADEVSAETLAMLLHDHAALRLIFLNACEGARGGRSDSFAGVAQRLVRQGIPAVLAMQFPVSDAAAIALSHAFYSALADGYPADSALSEARKAIAAQGNPLEWGTPVLFSRSDDNRLISPPNEVARPDGTQITIEQRVDTSQGEVTGVKVDTVQGDVIIQGSVIVTLPGMAAELAARLASGGTSPTEDLHQPVIETKPFEPETLYVPAGLFLMGTDADEGIPEHETPQHPVPLLAYRIGKYPVTNRQYAEFLKRNRGQPEPPRAGWSRREPPQDRFDHPVISVGWQDAVAYCEWLSRETGRPYRLPTEAEWEKAARGTDGRCYPWGNGWADGRCNVAASDTTPVNAHPTGASPCGCEDMLGNVEEWTSTLWGSDQRQSDYPYPYRPDDGREDRAAAQRLFRAYHIHRGGSYASQPSEVRCAARDTALEAKSESRWRGFRVVMKLS